MDREPDMLFRVTLGISIIALALAVVLLATGCFVVRALEGDPEKRMPDINLPELTLSTNVLNTNAPAIQ
jgi:hypothetical protein